jgi:hypothetical protein
MKSWILVGLALVLGIAGGIGVAALRLRACPWGGVPAGPGVVSPKSAQDKRPKLVVDGVEYNFGVMDSRGAGSHEFVFKNAGTSPLVLTKGSTSCKCTLSNVDESPIPPGGSANVKVEWVGKGLVGEFHQTATIKTNDPVQGVVTLTVVGRLAAAVRSNPLDVVFSRITAGDEATGTTRVYGYLPEPVQLKGYKLTDTATAKFFQVRYEPLSADQLKEEPDAQSGVLVTVTVKPGLPLGPFQQRIVLETNYSQSPTLELPVSGKIGSQISVVGVGWDEDSGLLTLGRVDGSKGIRRTLLLVAGGPHSKDIHYKPIEVVPDLLKVELGPATPMRGGTVIQTPLTIEIPPRSRPANHLGSEEGKLGRIFIETNHPQVPKLRILVRFVVEG